MTDAIEWHAFHKSLYGLYSTYSDFSTTEATNFVQFRILCVSIGSISNAEIKSVISILIAYQTQHPAWHPF